MKKYLIILLLMLIIFISGCLKDGKEKKIQQEIVELPVSEEDILYPCNQKNFKMGFILMNKPNEDINRGINKLNKIKEEFSKEFSYATNNIAKIDTSYPVVNIINSQDFGRYNVDLASEIMREFYKNNPDEFDFITIYPYTSERSSEVPTGEHDVVMNGVLGTGISPFDNSNLFGSNKKLKGINVVKGLSYFPSDYDYYKSGILTLLHETAHQWAISRFDLNPIILNDRHKDHYSHFLITSDPLGGYNWEETSKGKFRALKHDYVRFKYNQFTLYLAGFINYNEITENFKIIIPTKDITQSEDGQYVLTEGNIEEISIKDILSVSNIKRDCARLKELKSNIRGE